MIEAFLDEFYRAISFGAGEPFPAERLRALFRPDALLLEKGEKGGYEARTIETHIREFETAVRDYPGLFEAGFQERQTGLEWTELEGVFFVRSRYEKRYTRQHAPVVETGINHMTVVKDGARLRIACVIW